MAPDTIGVAIEVPVFLTYVPSLVPRLMISFPGARISGFTIQQSVGPLPLLISSKLPTVIIFLKFPAQLQKTVPGRSCPLLQQLPLPYPTIHLSASIS